MRRARRARASARCTGCPIGIKDIIDTADMPTENGCAVFKGRRPYERRRLRHGAAPRRRRHHGQDGDDRARHLHPVAHAQSAQPRAHARRLLLRLGRRRRRRHGARRARHADGRLRDPPRRLLRRLRLQADLRRHSPPRRADAGALARHGRRVSAARWRTWRCWPTRCRPTTSAIRASLSTSRPRLLATATEEWPLPPLFAFVKTHAWERGRRGDARGLRRARRGAGRPGAGDLASTRRTERGLCRRPARCRGWRWPCHYGPLLDRAPELLSEGLAPAHRGGRRVSGVEYIAALNARERLLRHRRGAASRLRHDPHAGRARARRPRASAPPATPCSAASGPISACRP